MIKVSQLKTDMENVFDYNAKEYDEWFEMHNTVYQSEISAIKKVIPVNKKGIEIGVGTGRFSMQFGILIGIEPSVNMAYLAEERGITVVNAVAENLPFHNESFDFVLMVTTVCFFSDIPKAFNEAHRILKNKGKIILGIIDKTSQLGKQYEILKNENKFYASAHFYSTEELTTLLKDAGFNQFDYWQTLLHSENKTIEKPRHGYGKGSFVVIKAIKH